MSQQTSPTEPEILPVATGRQTWAWLRGELRSRPWSVVSTGVVGLTAAAMAVLPVYVLGVLVDRIIDRAPSSVIVTIAVVVTVSALVGGVALGLSHYLIGRLGAVALADLREAGVERALGLPTTTVERVGRGDLLSRVSTDVATIGKAVSDVIPTMFASVLLGLLSLVAMLGLDWRLGLAGAIALPCYVVALRWYLPRSAPRYALERRAIAERSQVLMESMIGVETVHAYGLHTTHQRAIETASAKVRDISIGVFTLFTRFVGRINRAEFIGLATILVTGFWLVRHGEVTVGQTTAAALLFHRLFSPISTLLFTFDEAQDAGASLARLVGLVNVTAAPASVTAPAPEPLDGTLELDDVEFGYDDARPVVRGVGIRVEPGQRVALVGSTGAGKSTVAGLAAGALTPQRGSARIGGVALAAMTPGQRRRHVAIVSQEVHVFAGPLADDLRLADPEATDAQLREALRTVGADDWVDALPDGLDTVVGEGGHQLTAAQAQQLALARLKLADPTVAVLDEATAEAGSQGALVLERAAAAVTEGRTTLVIAHRLTQAASADRVVVMADGEVVEEGSHDELMAAGGRYARLWHAWTARHTYSTETMT
ncbi:ABC transporter permease [Mycolicibacterium madagascariense]|uniref:ABC transporter permease n=1 Tax=Mycolicibacterium madagascariense TaxID=212765 RepID=A0A7I7XCM1_9MYCO|nr:ABC transporter ATP-binding protein [Mycolicibacterium madagascariense]MCV7012891.1 ABC transporter ATP-binding protein [Mycolicibacterium madagascariense]BBZ26138.1 ABC transporter permease [Mycolicibacterium madagascariense]